MRLIRERRDYYWNWSDSEGWQSQFDQKDLQEGEESLDLQAGQIGKVSFPVEWGSYRLEVKGPDDVVSSVRFWAATAGRITAKAPARRVLTGSP
ncbi:alpha-2-macroglobulin [Klebsiella pneumoniae]|nr:alpha-2-macroglobulin [Klebsiella pneumoniae]